jgi:hypothetical protein
MRCGAPVACISITLRGTTKIGIVRACGVVVVSAMAAMARVGTGGNAHGDD